MRDGGVGQLDDEFVGLVMVDVATGQPSGSSWRVVGDDRCPARQGEGVEVEQRVMSRNARCVNCLRSGVFVPERTLNRYVDAMFPTPERSTVRVADGEPGSELQVQFGELGMMFDEESGRRRKVWALVFTAAFSRHTLVWLSFGQTLSTVICGFEEAWQFFGGVFRVVIPDNMATIVTNGTATDPTFDQAFVECTRSHRGFVIDPAPGPFPSRQTACGTDRRVRAVIVLGG